LKGEVELTGRPNPRRKRPPDVEMVFQKWSFCHLKIAESSRGENAALIKTRKGEREKKKNGTEKRIKVG